MIGTIPTRIDQENGRKIETPVSWGQLRPMAADRHNLFLVAFGLRPMARLFFTDLEHNFFPPMTPSNAEFQFFVLEFDGDPYLMACIPKRCKPEAMLVADRCGLRLADGVPHSISTGEDGKPHIEVFPLKSRNVWTLENRKDSILYKPGGSLDLREEETMRCEEIIAASIARVREAARQAMRG